MSFRGIVAGSRGGVRVDRTDTEAVMSLSFGRIKRAGLIYGGEIGEEFFGGGAIPTGRRWFAFRKGMLFRGGLLSEGGWRGR